MSLQALRQEVLRLSQQDRRGVYPDDIQATDNLQTSSLHCCGPCLEMVRCLRWQLTDHAEVLDIHSRLSDMMQKDIVGVGGLRLISPNVSFFLPS